jgi:hypothetical protein
MPSGQLVDLVLLSGQDLGSQHPYFRRLTLLDDRAGHPGFWMLKLPDGSKVEVFGPDSAINRHFTTGPVAGFLVDDIQGATAELRSAGVEILYESGVDASGNPWVHFRAPDGYPKYL